MNPASGRVLVRKPMLLSVLMFVSASLAVAQCEHTVRMATYSVCLPRGWSAEKSKSDDRVYGCNRESTESCNSKQFRGGLPLPGVVQIVLLPTEKDPYDRPYRSPEEVVSKELDLNGRRVPVTEIMLDSAQEGDRRCFRARTVLTDNVWIEVYGLKINSHLFRASAEYHEEPANIEAYQAAIVQILSSISVRTAPGKK